VLFACHAAGLSESEVRAWSAKSEKHTDKDKDFDQVWQYIKGRTGIGLGTLGMLAKQNGWEPKPKVGKSILALNTAYAVATGTPFLGMETTQGGVLLVSTDESANSTRLKMQRMGFTCDMPVAVMTSFDTQNPEPLIAALQKFRPALVVLDSLKSISQQVLESENSPEFANHIYKVKEILSAYECASILIHHTGKSKDNEGIYRLRGGSAISGAAWGVWLMQRSGENSVYLETISRDADENTLTLHLLLI